MGISHVRGFSPHSSPAASRHRSAAILNYVYFNRPRRGELLGEQSTAKRLINFARFRLDRLADRLVSSYQLSTRLTRNTVPGFLPFNDANKPGPVVIHRELYSRPGLIRSIVIDYRCAIVGTRSIVEPGCRVRKGAGAREICRIYRVGVEMEKKAQTTPVK